jgi:hypothetical protein
MIKMKIIQEDTKPVFDLTPHQVRMATCYRDRNGVYHLFSDYIDADTGTIDSWEAEIRYYKSGDLRNWEYVETPAPRGQAGEPDSFGAASPHVLATNDKIFLFYASRQVHCDAKMNCFAKSGEPGFMSGSIMMCVADADINGAPAGPFKKHGIVLKSGTGWNSMRLDDPCALLEGDTVHLYFKGFDNNLDHDRICVGHSSAKLNDMKFISDPKPVLSVPGGGEMPRLFMKEDKWNMFYRHFSGSGKPYSWHHHQSEDGISWNQNSKNFFAGRLGPSDIMLIYDMNGELPAEPQLLVAGSENGIQKLWLYKVCPN